MAAAGKTTRATSAGKSAAAGQEQPQRLKTPAELAAESKRNKARTIKMIAGGVVAFLSLIIWFGFQPLVAGMEYGICRTFLETRVRYPNSMDIIEYENFGKSHRIFYTHVDAFGGRRSDMLECIMVPHPVNIYVVEKININRAAITDEELKLFNLTIPSIIQYKPSLVRPSTPGEDYADLKR